MGNTRLVLALVVSSALVAAAGCGDDGGGGGSEPAADSGITSDSGGGEQPDAGDDGDAGTSGVVRLTTFTDGYALEPAPVAWVAGRDGDGLWQRLESDSGVYELEVDSGQWGFAWVCAEEDGRLHLDFGTVAETDAISRACRRFLPSTGKVEVALDGLAADDAARVFVHDDSSIVSQAAPAASFTVPARAHDVMAVIEEGGLSPSHIVIARDQVVTDTESQVELSAGSAQALTGHALSAAPVAANRFATLISRSGTRATLNETQTAYFGLDADALDPGDMHVLRAVVPAVDYGIEAYAYRHAAEDVHLTLPDVPDDPVVYVPVTVPSRLVEILIPTSPDADLYHFTASQGGLRLELTLTPGVLPDDSDFHALWIQPTLHYVSGWDDSWGLADGAFTWDLTTIRATGDERDPLAYTGFTPPGARGPRPAWDGNDVTFARSEGSFTP